MYFKTLALVGFFTAFAAHAGEDSCLIEQNQQFQQQQVLCTVQAPTQQAPYEQTQEQAQQAQEQAQQAPQAPTPVVIVEPAPQEQAPFVPDQQQGPTQAPIPQQDQCQQERQQQAVAEQGYAPYMNYSYVARSGARKLMNVRVVRHVHGADYGYLRVEAYEGYVTNTNIPAKLIFRHKVSHGVVMGTNAVFMINGDVVLNNVPVVRTNSPVGHRSVFYSC